MHFLLIKISVTIKCFSLFEYHDWREVVHILQLWLPKTTWKEQILKYSTDKFWDLNFKFLSSKALSITSLNTHWKNIENPTVLWVFSSLIQFHFEAFYVESNVHTKRELSFPQISLLRRKTPTGKVFYDVRVSGFIII